MNKYPSVKPAVWGAVAGAVAISVIGFSQFGWTLGSSAERMANERAQTAVVTVLTPICVEKFRQQSEATAKLAEFSKATSWDQALNHRKRRLGNDLWRRNSQLGGRHSVRREACPAALTESRQDESPPAARAAGNQPAL